jgi:hypothetical protein
MLPDLPRLEVGASYVLMMTRPSAIGMSSPVGLEQGLFRVDRRGSREGVDGSTRGGRAAASLTYTDFAQRVRQAVARSRRPQ